MNLIYILLLATFPIACFTKQEDNNEINFTPQPIKLDPKLRRALLRALRELENEDNTEAIDEQHTTLEPTTREEDVLASTQSPRSVVVHSFDANSSPSISTSLSPPLFTDSPRATEKIAAPFTTRPTPSTEKPTTAFNSFVIVQKSEGVTHEPIRSIVTLNPRQQDRDVIQTSATNDFRGQNQKLSEETNQPTPFAKLRNTATSQNAIAVTPKPVSRTDISKITFTTGKPTTTTEESAAKVEEVQFFSAPLVAAFTVHQDEGGLPRSVVPIFKDPALATTTTKLPSSTQGDLRVRQETQERLLREERIRQERLQQQQEQLQQQQLRQQEQLRLQQQQEQLRQQQDLRQKLQIQQQEYYRQLQEKQRVLEEQFYRLQQQQKQQDLLLKQQQQFQEQQLQLQRQRLLEEQQRILRNQQQQNNFGSAAVQRPAVVNNQQQTQTFSNNAANTQNFRTQNNNQQQLNVNQQQLNANQQQLNSNQQQLNSAQVQQSQRTNGGTIVSLTPSISLNPNENKANANLNNNNNNFLPLSQQTPVKNSIDFLNPPFSQTLLPPFQNTKTGNLNDFSQTTTSPQSNRVFRQETGTGNFGLSNNNNNNANDFTRNSFFNQQQSIQPSLQTNQQQQQNQQFFRYNTNFGVGQDTRGFFNPTSPRTVDTALQNLLFNSGITRGREQEDLSIVSKVLSLNHLGRNDLLFGASSQSQQVVPAPKNIQKKSDDKKV